MMVWVAGMLFCVGFLVGMSVMEVVLIMVIVVVAMFVMIMVMSMMVIFIMIVVVVMPLQINIHTLLLFPMDRHFHMRPGNPALY